MDYRPYVRERAQAYGLDPNLAEALVGQESGGNPNALSPKGAYGLMQLMPATAKELGVDPNIPEQNIDGGLRYLKQQIDRFGVEGGLAAYNGGPGRYEQRGQDLSRMPTETRNYVPAILNKATMLASNGRTVGQSTSTGQPSMDYSIDDLVSAHQNASQVQDTKAVDFFSGQLRQQFEGGLKGAQQANDAKAVEYFQGQLTKFGGVAPAPQQAAPAVVTPVATAPVAVPAPAVNPAAAISTEQPLGERIKRTLGTVGRTADNVVRGLADTLTFGYADEFAAKMDAKVKGTALDKISKAVLGKDISQSGASTYEDALKAQRQRDSEGGAARVVGQVGGALVPTGLAIQSAAGATRLARAGAGALTGAVQGGLYGTGTAEGDLTDRLKSGAIGAGTGAVLGGALSAILPTTVKQEANRFIKKAGTPENVKLDREIVLDMNDVFQREVRNSGGKIRPAAAIDANAFEKRYINEAQEALDKLAKVDKKAVPNVDEILFELRNKGSTPSVVLENLKKSVAGKAAMDALLKSDRVRTLTGQQTSTGGPIAAAARMGVEASPSMLSAATGVPVIVPQAMAKGVTNQMGGSVPRAKVINKLLSPKQVEAARETGNIVAGPSQASSSLNALNKAVGTAQKTATAKKLAEEAAAQAAKAKEATTKIQVLQDTRMPQTGAFANLLSGGKSNLNLKTDDAIDGLRLVSRQFKNRPVGEAAKTILKSNNVDDSTSAFYGVQNQIRKLQERGVLDGQAGALSPFMEQGGKRIFNKQAYDAAIKTADAARQFAVENAPNKALGQFANTVAKTVNPTDKLKLVEARLEKTTDAAVRDYLENLVRPLTEYGAKAKK